jgi:UDP-3-O-[3-hydroxymyristoyl] glucosamine N-acyltransferase
VTVISHSLGELAKLTGGEVKGDVNCIIQGVATLQEARPGYIAFLANPIYRKYLSTTQASAVILSSVDVEVCQTNALIVKDPYAAYARITHCFAPKSTIQSGIHASAIVAETAEIHPTCSIGPNVVIGNNVKLGEHSVVSAGCIIGDNVQMGTNVLLHPRVTLYPRVILGNRVVVYSGAVIGSDGFGFAFDKQQNTWIKIHHAGTVRVGDDVEIGANTTIDRGALDDTVINNQVKIDNQVQLAHNVHIGAFTVIAGCVGIAGSTHIGRYCQIGGGAGIAGHLEITDNVAVSGLAMVTGSISEPGVYASGTGLMASEDWRKNVVRFRHLDELARRVRQLEKSANERVNNDTKI